LILLIGGTASDDGEAKAEAEVATREDRDDGRAKMEAEAGVATVGARGEMSVSFMIKEILWRCDDDEGSGTAGTSVRNRCQA